MQKKKFYTQDFLLILVILVVCVAMALFLTVGQNGWRDDSDGVQYLHYGKAVTGFVELDSEGHFVSIHELGDNNVDHLLYWFSEEGYFTEGWNECPIGTIYQDRAHGIYTGEQVVQGEKYHFEEDGRLVTGLFQDEEGNLLLHDAHGYLETGFVTVGDDTFYADAEGRMQFGWQEIDGSKYYFDETTGRMQTGLQELEGSTYHFGTDGKMQTGFLEMEGGTGYFNVEGRLQTGEFRVGKKEYLADENGVLYKGFLKQDGRTYYYNESDYSLYKGWMKNGDSFTYFSEDGSRASGWTEIEDNKYYFDPEQDDCLLTGWQNLDGKDYYFTEDGIMSHGLTTISGKTYYFYEDGSLARNTKVGNYNIDADGVATNPYEVITKDNLDAYIEVLLDTYGRDLYSIYYYCLSHFTYKYRAKLDVDSMACRILNNGNGACWDYAALCYKMMKAAGYNVQIVVGKGAVASEHNWVIVEVSPGVWRHYDPERRGYPIYNMTDAQLSSYNWAAPTVRYEWDHSAYPAAE